MSERFVAPALRVNQWLPEWDAVAYDHEAHRDKPDPYFFVFALPASKLKRLTGVYPRLAQPGQPRSDELSTQRRHDQERSDEISAFVRYGHPWADLSPAQRTADNAGLKKPGWLPTAILINVLRPGDVRDGRELHEEDAAYFDGSEGRPELVLPAIDNEWTPRPGGIHPFEVIDGQHRLWAFEDAEIADSFELPVVAFHGLDRSWQAYLFWTINIKPKKINASLAYDLFPLLRSEEWLERFGGPYVYREARAQELVEAMWAHPLSPWHNRINMLGERGNSDVRQAAWVRSLVNTMVKPLTGARVRVGGLFGAASTAQVTEIPWARPQQAAFLIEAWRLLAAAIADTRPSWIEHVKGGSGMDDPMFASDSLLNTDQGVRAFLGVLNDLTVIRREEIGLDAWEPDPVVDGRGSAEDALKRVSLALGSLQEFLSIESHLLDIAAAVATFDWRTSAAGGLSEDERRNKLVYRGTSGYRQLKLDLLAHVAAHGPEPLQPSASKILEMSR